MNQQGQIVIPKPCHENWMDMSKQESTAADRHCGICCKTVMDFTSMPTEKVIEILSRKKDENICGRFREDQLNENRSAIKSPRNRYRIFMAALYVVFGGLLFTSCRTKDHGHKMGKSKIERSFQQDESGFNNVDTPSSRTRHKIDQKADPVSTKICVLGTDTIEPEIHMLGEAVYMPEDTTKK